MLGDGTGPRTTEYVARYGDFSPGPIALPRPGKVLRIVLLGLLSIWLLFALLVNWTDSGAGLFLLLTGNTQAIVGGQIWRLVTAPLLHVPTGTIGHIFSALLGLYFLAPSLEEQWGSARFARFLFLTGTLSYATQFLCAALLGPDMSVRIVPPDYYGAMPVVEGVAIAWASTYRGRTVNLFFIFPVTSRGLILFVVGMSLMILIAGATPPSGHIALFAGMGYGYLLGGSTPSPIRRWYLKYRLARLEADAAREMRAGGAKRPRGRAGGFRVIEGGKGDRKDLN